MTKPIPKIYATRFFQLVTSRQFAEADRILERIKQKMHISERNRGYFQALYGMLLTQRNNNDRYAFLSSIDLTNKKQLKKYRQEFLSHAESHLHAEYDRGFFEAWADYFRVLPRLEVPVFSTINKSVVEKEAEAQEVAEKKITNEEKELVEQVTVESKRKKEFTEEKTETEQVEPHQKTLFEFAK